MARNGKKFKAAAEQVEDRFYSLDEAIPLLQKVGYAGFDEAVEMALRLGVHPSAEVVEHGPEGNRSEAEYTFCL